jgi:5-methylcytosine-specific restriction endonuclease McrA
MPNAPRIHRPKRANQVLQVERVLSDRGRPNANARGYTYQWSKAAKAFLALYPLCAECMRHCITAAATVVDHIIPHRGDKKLFWSRSNWQSLCKPCHDSKTGKGQ